MARGRIKVLMENLINNDVKYVRMDFRAFRALGSGKRISILRMIMDGASTFKQLRERLNMRDGTLGYHVKMLLDAGLIEHDGRGYRATRLARALLDTVILIDAAELDEMIARAEDMYRSTGDHVYNAVAEALKWVKSRRVA
jgi:DNA-binding transcriptional ArsR family regulator